MKEQREHKRGRRITWLARAATHGLARAATHRLARAAACGLILAASLGWLRAAGTAELLPENILRLHVVANSDSQEDQSLKLLVRDAVLEEASRWCAGAESLEAANREICTHLEGITRAAEKTLREQGRGEEVRAWVTEEFFPTREYEGFVLPAGRYRALRVSIGKGEGHNWWCVVFPGLCLPAAGEGGEPLAELPEGQRELVKNGGRYKVELKVTELYQKLREWMRG